MSVPQDRQKAICGTLRKDIGKILRELREQMGWEVYVEQAISSGCHGGNRPPCVGDG